MRVQYMTEVNLNFMLFFSSIPSKRQWQFRKIVKESYVLIETKKKVLMVIHTKNAYVPRANWMCAMHVKIGHHRKGRFQKQQNVNENEWKVNNDKSTKCWKRLAIK